MFPAIFPLLKVWPSQNRTSRPDDVARVPDMAKFSIFVIENHAWLSVGKIAVEVAVGRSQYFLDSLSCMIL